MTDGSGINHMKYNVINADRLGNKPSLSAFFIPINKFLKIFEC